MIECDNNEEFIIANLSSSVINETLDLAFNEGEKICFKVDGPGTVHLTGNLMDEDNLSPTGEGFDMLAGSDSEMESEEEEAAGEKIQEVVEKSGKRKKVEVVKNSEVVAKKPRLMLKRVRKAKTEMKVGRRPQLMLTPLQMPPRVTTMMMTATTVMMKMIAKKKRILKRLKEQSLNRRRKEIPKQRRLQL